MLQELTHMDRITQLQDEIQQLLRVSPAVPVTKARKPEKVDAPEVLAANTQELVRDLLAKAKQVEYLISALPVPEAFESQDERLEALDQEMGAANAEYEQALARAKRLHAHIEDALGIMLADPVSFAAVPEPEA